VQSIKLRVNGSDCEVRADPLTPLAYVLRNTLGLTGTKLACGLEQCGACAVLVDGEATLSCVAPVLQFEGHDIVTVEGLHRDGVASSVQQAFVEQGAAQCGYCTPGLVIAVTAMLAKTGDPDETDIQRALSGHLCRCGTHNRVLAAIRELMERSSA
jgi:aerobic-type carbon monoxide dehydrogenase small subunit (CoxS/CutS family)